MNYQLINYEVKGGIAFVYLNRPAAQNAINWQLRSELVDVIEQIKNDQTVKAMVLASKTAGMFSVGVDVDEILDTMKTAKDSGTAVAELRRLNALSNPWEELARQPKPMVVALNGLTLGAALELALVCDVRVCSENASYGFPEVTMGLIPMHGGSQRLPRIIGRGKALEMILSGESIDAAEAMRVELVTKVVPEDQLLQAAEEVARLLASRAPLAIEYAREAVTTGLDMTFEQGLHLEMDLYALLQTTADRAEGLRSFREKRAPEYHGE
jgi:enoyl-CoA hydratase